MESRRSVVLTLLTCGKQSGRLPATAYQLFGLFWCRLLVGHQPLEPAQAADRIRRLLNGLHARHRQ